MMEGGVVRALLVGETTGGPMERRDEIMIIAGIGIEGDRYAQGGGSFSRGRIGKGWGGLAVTLIEEEGIEAARRDFRLDIDFETARRNVVTSGIRLDSLVGREFRLGSALLRGVASNPPCSRLEKLAGLPGWKKALKGRGGIRADVVQSGPVKVGDRLTLLPESAGSRSTAIR